MKRMKKFLSLLLALVMLLGLAACGKTDGDAPAMPKGVDFRPAAFYKAEKIPLPDENGFVVGSCADGETLYYMLEEEDGTFTLYRAGLAEGTVEKLPGYTPAETKNELRVLPRGLWPDGQGGLWLLETWTSINYKLPDDFDPEKDDKYLFSAERGQHAVLRRLDGSTGREKESRELTGLEPDFWTEWQGDWTVDGQGRLYLAGDTGVMVLDEKGAYSFTLEAKIKAAELLGGRCQALAQLADGSVGVLTGTKKEGNIRTIDPEKKGWSEMVYTAPSETNQIYSGQGDFLFFSATSGALYGYAAGEADPYKLLEWSAAGVSGGAVQSFGFLPESRTVILTCSDDKAALFRLTPSDTAADGRTVITLGTIMPSSFWLHSVQRFNDDNTDYYVVVRDYAEDLMDNGMTYEERYAAALKRLEIEMVSGRVPDILEGNELPLVRYAGKGVLEDLWPWIDGDSELGRDKLMTHVLDCASQEGKLYQIGASFTISSLVAPVDRFPAGTRPTLEEIMALYEAMPEGSLLLDSGMGPDYVLGVFSMYGSSFVD